MSLVVVLTASAMGTVALAEQEPTDGEEEISPEEAQRRARPLAKIGDVTISVGDFEDRLNQTGPFRRMQYSSPEKRREFLEQMIEMEVLARYAQEQGYGDDPTVENQLKRVMSNLMLRREVDDRIRPEDVTDEEMQAYYDEHITSFKRPERVRAYHIVISDREKAQTLLDRVLEEDVGTREFRRLAREMSEDPVTKRRGGDLRYFTRPEDRREDDPEVHPAIVDATFKLLKQREVALARAEKNKGDERVKRGPRRAKLEGFNPVYPKLVKTPQGYHIIRFMGHRDAVNREFETVERQIRNRIWREKLQKAREDFIASLREKHKVTIHEDNIALIKVAPVARRSRRGRLRPRPRPRRGRRGNRPGRIERRRGNRPGQIERQRGNRPERIERRRGEPEPEGVTPAESPEESE